MTPKEFLESQGWQFDVTFGRHNTYNHVIGQLKIRGTPYPVVWQSPLDEKDDQALTKAIQTLFNSLYGTELD